MTSEGEPCIAVSKGVLEWMAETVPLGALTIPVYEEVLSTPKLERASEGTQLRARR